MTPTSRSGRHVAVLPGVVVACVVALLGGYAVAPYYDAYGNPIAPAVVAPAPVAAYSPYPYDLYYYYGPAYYPAPVYPASVFDSVWIGGGGCWGHHHDWSGRGWGGRGWSHGGGWGYEGGWGHRH